MIDYKIKSFLMAAQEQNISRAAERLGLTQPAVSQHIKLLEQEYGTPLFIREGRCVTLSEAGIFLFKESKKLNTHSQWIKESLKLFVKGENSLRLGVTKTVGEYILPQYLQAFEKAYPAIKISFFIKNTTEILNQLNDRAIDLSLIEGIFNPQSICSHPFLEDEMSFICSPRSPYASLKSINLKTLSKAPLILREKGSGTRSYFEQYLIKENSHIDFCTIKMEVESLSAIKSLVERDFGISVMSTRAIKKEVELKSLQTIPFKGPSLTRGIPFVFLEEASNPFIMTFINFCKKMD